MVKLSIVTLIVSGEIEFTRERDSERGLEKLDSETLFLTRMPTLTAVVAGSLVGSAAAASGRRLFFVSGVDKSRKMW